MSLIHAGQLNANHLGRHIVASTGDEGTLDHVRHMGNAVFLGLTRPDRQDWLVVVLASDGVEVGDPS